MPRSSAVRVKRVYEPPERGDGDRLLVDRLWPRGLRKEDAHLAAWLREVAPSTELRRWYGHRPERFDEFAERYRAELRVGDAADALRDLARRAGRGTVTLLTATRDVEHSGAAVLAGAVRRRGAGRAR
jgi:uncharacterized protein YeaO (DUF488 family)